MLGLQEARATARRHRALGSGGIHGSGIATGRGETDGAVALGQAFAATRCSIRQHIIIGWRMAEPMWCVMVQERVMG